MFIYGIAARLKLPSIGAGSSPSGSQALDDLCKAPPTVLLDDDFIYSGLSAYHENIINSTKAKITSCKPDASNYSQMIRKIALVYLEYQPITAEYEDWETQALYHFILFLLHSAVGVVSFIIRFDTKWQQASEASLTSAVLNESISVRDSIMSNEEASQLYNILLSMNEELQNIIVRDSGAVQRRLILEDSHMSLSILTVLAEASWAIHDPRSLDFCEKFLQRYHFLQASITPDSDVETLKLNAASPLEHIISRIAFICGSLASSLTIQPNISIVRLERAH